MSAARSGRRALTASYPWIKSIESRWDEVLTISTEPIQGRAGVLGAPRPLADVGAGRRVRRRMRRPPWISAAIFPRRTSSPKSIRGRRRATRSSRSWGRRRAPACLTTRTGSTSAARRSSSRFFNPDVLDQQVYIVRFDGNGVVASVDRKDLQDGRDIEPVPGATPAPGRELTFLEQVLGNMGRFNKSSRLGRARGESAGTQPPQRTRLSPPSLSRMSRRGPAACFAAAYASA